MEGRGVLPRVEVDEAEVARQLSERGLQGGADLAQRVIEAAKQEHISKVGESEIVRAAEAKGQEIRDEAMVEAQEIVQDAQRRAIRMQNESESTATSRREGADQYAREVMFGMEEQLSEILGQIRRGIDTLRDQPENTPSPDIQIPVS